MKKLILIFLVSISIKISFAQDLIEDNVLCVKIAPLSLLDIYSGTSPRIGVEYKIKGSYAFYNEIGSYIPNANAMINNKGVLTKFEVKRYLNNSDITLNSYISAELFYKHQSYYTYDTITNLSNNYLKDYFVKKDVGCFTVKYGILKSYNYGFVLDYFVGLGIRYKTTQSTLTDNENKNIQPEGDYHINVLKNKAGSFTYVNFDMGIKIGYSIK